MITVEQRWSDEFGDDKWDEAFGVLDCGEWMATFRNRSDADDYRNKLEREEGNTCSSCEQHVTEEELVLVNREKGLKPLCKDCDDESDTRCGYVDPTVVPDDAVLAGHLDRPGTSE